MLTHSKPLILSLCSLSWMWWCSLTCFPCWTFNFFPFSFRFFLSLFSLALFVLDLLSIFALCMSVYVNAFLLQKFYVFCLKKHVYVPNWFDAFPFGTVLIIQCCTYPHSMLNVYSSQSMLKYIIIRKASTRIFLTILTTQNIQNSYEKCHRTVEIIWTIIESGCCLWPSIWLLHAT